MISMRIKLYQVLEAFDTPSCTKPYPHKHLHFSFIPSNIIPIIRIQKHFVLYAFLLICLGVSETSGIRLVQLGVWALLVNENFSHVISGSRDKKVFITELRNPGNSILVCEESAPVLSLCYNIDQTGVWTCIEKSLPNQTTTWNSDIKCWKLPRCDRNNYNSVTDTSVTNGKEVEVACIKGGAAIKKYAVMNDKRHILTKDTDKNVAIYDVLKVTKVKDLGQVDFDSELKQRNQKVYIPNWFTVDLKTGMPTIVLGQDEVDCFAAWVSAEAGLPDHIENGSDLKINYGSLLLQALLEHWSLTHTHTTNEEVMKGNDYFQVPKHTPVIFSEIGGRTVCRLLVRDAAGDNESALLNETVPTWVSEIVIEKTIPKFIKIPFYLLPHPQMVKQDRLKKDRLVANEFLQCRKVCEHVLDKILGSDSASGVNAMTCNNSQSNQNDNSSEGSQIPPEDKIELFCNDVPLDPNMDLRTVRHFIWKQSVDLTFYYKTKSNFSYN